ncbi:MAG: hypothetical protein K2Y02_01440, partial [Burkholderiaceae bacterium]|nr:hypothetical protein [Burkholderiaceae bacterium]
GTRHGKGGGWYDRFLSKTPAKWLRIGVLNETRLSATLLTRESWDEPMDFLALQTEVGWHYIETRARL